MKSDPAAAANAAVDDDDLLPSLARQLLKVGRKVKTHLKRNRMEEGIDYEMCTHAADKLFVSEREREPLTTHSGSFRR